MIKVSEKFGIEVDANSYITGKITINKKNEEKLTSCRYFQNIYNALQDIADRECKEQISDVTLLREALEIIAKTYKKYYNLLDDLKKEIEGVTKNEN